jgi:hypothetical protein
MCTRVEDGFGYRIVDRRDERIGILGDVNQVLLGGRPFTGDVVHLNLVLTAERG